MTTKPKMPVLFNEIKAQTELNNHSNAISRGLELLSFKQSEREAMQDELVRIVDLHNRQGHLTADLSERRRAIYQRMMGRAKRQFSPDVYKAFYSCF